MVTELELKLKDYFNVPYLVLVSNGTIALQIAIKSLELKGEIITTPYSYVATTSTIIWENCIPRFADINPLTFNIDPIKIREQITSKTQGILATNVYGYPCNFDELNAISEEFKIPIIYDNAHGFSTKYKKSDILNFGTISTISFHATKLFHSVEGGAIVCQDEKTYKKLLLLRNFGHTSPNTFDGVGINGKMNELCAAMGLVNLNFIAEICEKRKSQWLFYKDKFSSYSIKDMNYDLSEIDFNYAYFPILFESELQLLKVIEHLEKNNISARRYFYPSLNTLNYLPIKDECPISEDISKRVLCLPLYHDLTVEEQNLILTKIKEIC
jgi:dTDP-4-amino-4,6-dideoxygalactose transaminase